jgi:hypothetical protein
VNGASSLTTSRIWPAVDSIAAEATARDPEAVGTRGESKYRDQERNGSGLELGRELEDGTNCRAPLDCKRNNRYHLAMTQPFSPPSQYQQQYKILPAIRTWLLEYDSCMRRLREGIQTCTDNRDHLTTGSFRVIPRRDGILVVVSEAIVPEVKTEKYEDSSLALAINDETTFSDPDTDTNIPGINMSITSGFGHFVFRISHDDHGPVWIPGYNFFVVGYWSPKRPQPSEIAMERVSLVRISLNLQDHGVGGPHDRNKVLASGMKVLEGFRDLVYSDLGEQPLQKYLEEHPEILFPDFVEVYPQRPLGTEYVADFLFRIRSIGGDRWVFVEIENPTDIADTKKGDLSHKYTHAKCQLIDWEIWLQGNRSYLESQLKQSIGNPEFLLVMGREIAASMKKKIDSDFSKPGWRFASYVSVADRFETLLKRLCGQMPRQP